MLLSERWEVGDGLVVGGRSGRERERQRWKRLVGEVERKKRKRSGKSWGRIKGGKAPVREGNTEPREGSG
jgi:hypothetical protein